MAKIDTWLANQLPDMRKSMTVLKGVDFLHISTDQAIKKMRPRIGFRQMKVEDRTIPRICGASNLIGCIYGHTAVRHSYVDYYGANDTSKPWNGLFAVYKMPVEAVIKPSKRLVPDGPQTGEIWVVPYAPEMYEIVPSRVGTVLLHSTSSTIVNGAVSIKNVFYLKVDAAFKLTDKNLTPGFYSFELMGDLTAYNGEAMAPVQSLSTLSAGEWNNALSKLRAVAKERAEAT